MESITIRMPDEMLRQLDDLVAGESLFKDKSEAIRYAVREQLQREATEA